MSARRRNLSKGSAKLRIVAVDESRWHDLEQLFGRRGACGGCWCMWWRLTKREFERNRGDANRASLHALVSRGPAPGLLAFVGGTAVGWCAVAPRSDLPRLDASRALARIDDSPVWSIGCLFVAREHRRAGISGRLVQEATRYAAQMGAMAVEAYPIDTEHRDYPAAFAWTGFAPTFRAAGFTEVARRTPRRPIMRRRTSDTSCVAR